MEETEREEQHMVKSMNGENGNLLVNFQLPKIDEYLKSNKKYLEDPAILTFDVELDMIGDFTDLICKYIKAFELLYVMDQQEDFDLFLATINSLYHQFLKNILMNEKDMELLMKRYFELKTMVTEKFGKKFIF